MEAAREYQLSDEDLARVKNLALEKRPELKAEMEKAQLH